MEHEKIRKKANALAKMLLSEISGAGITQKQIEVTTGIRQNNLSKLNGGMSIAKFLTLCYAAGLDPAEIIGYHSIINTEE